MVSGGWVSRWSPPEAAVERFQKLLDAGFTVFAVRHGSSPLFKVPDAVADVRLATRYIRANAARWGVDPARLGAFGGSAGGHLSLMLGLAPDEGDATASDPILKESNRVAAVVAYFPPVDLTRMTGPNDRFPALDFASDAAAAISPVLFVSKDDPPTLLIHGDSDTLVPLSNSERIFAEFEKTGVTTNLIVLKGAGHGFRGKDAEDATEALVAWFARHLASAAAPLTTAAR
jgi:acetyl esterase/lipase